MAWYAMCAIERAACLKTGLESRSDFAEGRPPHYRLSAASHSRTHRNGGDVCATRELELKTKCLPNRQASK